MAQPLGASILILLTIAQPLAQTLWYISNAWLKAWRKAAEQFVFSLGALQCAIHWHIQCGIRAQQPESIGYGADQLDHHNLCRMHLPSTNLQGRMKRKTGQADDPEQEETDETQVVRDQRLEMLPALTI